MKVNPRLLRLEARYGQQPGCRLCRTWDRHRVVCCDDHDPPHCTRPAVCDGCGRHVPLGTTVIITGANLEDI